MPLRSWLSAHAPFPQFRSALLDAEAYLNGVLARETPQAWRALGDAASDGDAAQFDMLGALLAAQRLRLEMSRVRGEWMLVAVGVVPREASAAVAIAALLDGGGGRLKRCRVDGCVNVFLDWTNGASRTACRLHPRHPAPVSDRRGRCGGF